MEWNIVLLALAALLLPSAVIAELRRPGAYPLMNFCGVAASAFLAADALSKLLSGAVLGVSADGWALLALAGVYAGAALWAFRGYSGRDLGTVLAGASATVLAVAVAVLVSGEERAIIYALAAVLLGSLATHQREPRFQVGALAFLALAVAHAVVVQAPPTQLLFDSDHPAGGVPSVAAAVLASFALARYAVLDAAEEGDAIDEQIAGLQWRLRSWLPVVAVLLSAYGVCLLGLEAAQALTEELSLLQREVVITIAGLLLLVVFDMQRRLRRSPEHSLDEGRFEA